MTNKILLTGRITDQPELRQTPAGDYVCTFYLECKQRKNGVEDGTRLVKCEAWNNTADFLTKYIKKGILVDIEGSIRYKRYQDKEGKTRTEQIVRIDVIDLSPTNGDSFDTSSENVES